MDYSKCRSVDHEGTRLPEAYESLAVHLPKIKAMEIWDDDVMLCCYPKSGTHWLYRVLDMLQRGSSEYCERNLESTHLDIQRIELISELASPRVLATHMPFDLLPQQIKDKRTKLVHVYRNPRAVLVSYYFMVNAFIVNDSQAFRNKAIELESDFFSEKMLYRGWFGYMDSISTFQKDNPDQPIIHVSYEEMTMNPMATVKKLAEFLEKTVTPVFCAQVAEACGFKKQKQAEESLNSEHVPLKFYRKGDMNDWKNHLTVALDEKFDKILLERAKICPFSAKYIGSSLPHDQ
ncbi:hypothetical protein V1264_022477 [Littorina saxatilis]|uniref:Sulfotransferase domain-containing protein n=2 Tax=Littorina saxatilis TaxID=31220 RepID=A0AAN9AKE4_9CAEN